LQQLPHTIKTITSLAIGHPEKFIDGVYNNQRVD
jgi:hypothetical protein